MTTASHLSVSPSPDDASVKMLSVFGCAEMEAAAREICRQCRLAKTWHVSIDLDPFRADSFLHVGWSMLCERGWLNNRDCETGHFKVTKNFVKRVTCAGAKFYDQPDYSGPQPPLEG